MNFLEYHGKLQGYNYFKKGKSVYRFELFAKKIPIGKIFSGEAGITFEKRVREKAI